MEQVCKILKLDFGRNIMMQKMRENGVLLSSNTPPQRLITNGSFKVVEELIDKGRFKKLVATTYATSKGVGVLHKLFNI